MLNVTRAACVVLLAAFVLACTSVTAPAIESPQIVTVLPSASPVASALPSAAPTFAVPSLDASLFPSVAPSLPLPSLATPYPSTSATPTLKPTKPPTPTPKPTPAPARIKSFTAPQTVDCNVDPQPTQIRLEWSVARATGVTISIDGPGIYDSYDGATGFADVPFACGSEKHKYLLTTTGSDGAVATETRVVKRALPATSMPTP